MAEITDREDGRNLIIPLDQNGFLSYSILKQYFSEAIGLVYKGENEKEVAILFDESMTKLIPPEGGWGEKVFYVVRPSSRPHIPAASQEVAKIINSWENRVFLIKGDKLVGSCVLIHEQHILTAAHLSFKLHQSYKIEGAESRSFSVRCQFISKSFDFAILQSDDLPNLRLPIDHLRRGDKYFVMGYPSGVDTSSPTITKGIIEGIMDDCVHLVGSPGSKQGYSGTPVFSDSGKLAGLLLGGTTGLSVNTTIQECLDSSAEQKYARILGIGFIINCYNRGSSDNEC